MAERTKLVRSRRGEENLNCRRSGTRSRNGPVRRGGHQPRKRQRTAALQDAVATDRTPFLPRGLGVRLSSAALTSVFDRELFVGFEPSASSPRRLRITSDQFVTVDICGIKSRRGKFDRLAGFGHL